MGHKNKRSRYDEHHLRPRSRGGNNHAENLRILHKKSVHDPCHCLYLNLRTHEIALLFILSWKTQYIPNLRKSFDGESFVIVSDAWRKLFGNQATIESALRFLKNTFVHSREDSVLMEQVLKLSIRVGARVISEEKASVEEREEWRPDVYDAYNCVFGRLDPHEAVLITFFSWWTVCPYQEFSTPTTNKIVRKSMKNRKRAWNKLFGRNAKLWDAIRVLERTCDKRYHPQMYALVKDAIAICKAAEGNQ